MEYNTKVKDELIRQLSETIEERKKKIYKPLKPTFFITFSVVLLVYLLWGGFGEFGFFLCLFGALIISAIAVCIAYFKVRDNNDDEIYNLKKINVNNIISIMSSLDNNGNVTKIAQNFYDCYANELVNSFLRGFSVKAKEGRSDLEKGRQGIGFKIFFTHLEYTESEHTKTISFKDLGIDNLPKDINYYIAVEICVIEKLVYFIERDYKDTECAEADLFLYGSPHMACSASFYVFCDNPNYIKPEDLKKW